MPRLLSLGPFNLIAIGQQFLIMDPAQIGGGPDQVGQVAIYNYSSFLVGITSTTDGAQLDLQPGTAMVYDPPSRGGRLVGTVKSGSASTASSVVTAQVALDGARIEGAWPQTLSSVALQSNVPVNAGALQGVPIATTTPSTNQVLEFNGNDWAPATLPSPPPSGATLIQSQTIASGTTGAITFSNIPATYTHLLLVASLLSTYTSGQDEAFFRFNGDTGADYYYSGIWGGYAYKFGTKTLSSVSPTFNSAAGAAAIGTAANAGGYGMLPSTAISNALFGNYELLCLNYTSNSAKSGRLNAAYLYPGASPIANCTSEGAFGWDPATQAAINSISILTYSSGAAWGPGQASLYGLA